MTPEAKVLKTCLKELKRLRDGGAPINWFKVAGGPRQQSGHPDLIVCFHGRLCCAELKAPGGKATPLQEHRLAQWADAGAIVGVVDSVEGLRELLAEATA